MVTGAKIEIILECAKYLEKILLLGVGAHLVENRGNEGLETGFTVLADSGRWDVWILLGQTIFYLYSLVMELCSGICPGFTCRWRRRRGYL